MSTAVWMVMWSEPAIRAPASGLEAAYSIPRGCAISAGIFCLGDPHLFAAPFGQREVGHDEIGF